MQRVAQIWILFLVVHSKVISGSTLLRTAVIDRGTPSELDWLSSSGQRRQLLGYTEGKDARWGPLRGRMQLLLQLAEGYTSKDADRLVAQLHAAGAVISSSLPDHTWLVLATPEALKPAAYRPHNLVPYLPEYKLAPEWHPVLELVQQEAQQKAAADPSYHLQVHKRILAQRPLQHLKLADAAQHLRHAAAASAANASVSQEVRHKAPAKVLIGVQFPEMQQADLLRLKVKPESFHPAAAAASDWENPLRTVVMDSKRCPVHQQLCQPELIASSPWQLDVAVCPQDLSEVLYWLSNQAVVHWLAPRPRIYYQNLAAAKIIQTSTMKTALDYSTPEAAVFWSAGLDGKGQIVGIGDSGIDMNSCFFSDPAVPWVAPTTSREWISPQHRKVVYYWALADETFRDLVGHGTHTAGSIAGFNPAAPDSKATGAAKSAKLAFVDLSRTAGGDVNAPQDLERNYFPKMYERGACIFSDSWGSTSPVYDFQASKLDSWLYNNQDCISHFAAGNYGENDNLDSTITSPATAKNAVTVGATKSAVANYVSQTIAPVFMMSVEIKRPNRPLQYVGVRLVRAEFGGDGASLSNKGLRVVRAVPDTACTPLEGAAGGGYTNTILLVRRGTCYFSKKLEMGAAAGVAAVVVINDVAGGYFKMDANAQTAGVSSTVPLFSVTKRIGEQMWSFFDTAEQIAATIERYAQGWPAYEDIASFSSFGPTKDGRIKPEIVAPGELVSAVSGDLDPSTENVETCNIGRKSGTSMATPMVAGHTAIIRQYFMEGFYPTGATGNTPFLPSGPLMKAVMLGGACDMQGNTEQYLPLEDSPSMRQGFGRYCLCNALKLANKCNTNMQLVDRVPITSQDSHKYCLRTTGGDVRVTLSWYDYPAQVSAEKTLVNDLDLVVVSGGMGGQAFFGNMELKKDSINTVERVWLRNVPPGGLEITVSSGQLSPNTRSQNYSLVVQGAFVDTLNSPYNPDPTASRTPSGCSPEVMAATPPALVQQVQPAPAPAPAVVEEKAAVATAAVAAAAVNASPTATPNASTAPVQQPAAAAAVAPQPQPATAPDAAAAAAAVAVQQAPVGTPAIAIAPAVLCETGTACSQAAAAQPAITQPLPVPPVTPAAAAAAAAPAAAAAAQPQPAAQPVAAAAAAQPQPVAQPVVAPVVAPALERAADPLPAPPAPVQLPQVTPTTDQASLVSALVGAMTHSVAGGTTAAVPDAAAAAVAAAKGRRLTWVPTPSMPAWMLDSNMSVVIKVPMMVCRWLNATAKKAAAATTVSAPGAGAGRSLQAQAAGPADATASTLLIPLQHLALAGAMVLVCGVLLSIGMRHYQLYRGVSLTSAVRKDMSLNKAMGRAPTGEDSLMQALLADPSLIEQLSPTKRANLGLAASPFVGSVSFSSSSSSGGGNDSTGNLLATLSSGLTPTPTPSHNSADSPMSGPPAGTPAPYEPLRVRLARHSATGGSMWMPAPYRPCSVPPGAVLPEAHSAPVSAMHSASFSGMHSAPVSPVGALGLSAGSFSGALRCARFSAPSPMDAAADTDASELRVVVDDRPISRVSDSGLPLSRGPFSPDCQLSPRRLRRCSRSFTFGKPADKVVAAAVGERGGEVCYEVFGLSAKGPGAPEAMPKMHLGQQLRSRSMQEQRHAVLQVQQQLRRQEEEDEALLAHWRPLSPAFAADGMRSP